MCPASSLLLTTIIIFDIGVGIYIYISTKFWRTGIYFFNCYCFLELKVYFLLISHNIKMSNIYIYIFLVILDFILEEINNPK